MEEGFLIVCLFEILGDFAELVLEGFCCFVFDFVVCFICLLFDSLFQSGYQISSFAKYGFCCQITTGSMDFEDKKLTKETKIPAKFLKLD